MKTAYEIAKEELKDFTYFPSINKIVKCMEIFAEQKALFRITNLSKYR